MRDVCLLHERALKRCDCECTCSRNAPSVVVWLVTVNEKRVLVNKHSEKHTLDCRLAHGVLATKGDFEELEQDPA